MGNPIENIKILREKTNAGVADCKKALVKAAGNIDEAIKILHHMGKEMALDKKERQTQQGLIESYIHTGGRIGVLLEINCETDFVARNPGFKKFAKDVAMQIAALNPFYINKDNIPEEFLDSKRKELSKFVSQNETEEHNEQKLKDELEKFFCCVCLLEQSFIKDESLKIKDYLNTTIAKFGENIRIRRFVRYELGE